LLSWNLSTRRGLWLAWLLVVLFAGWHFAELRFSLNHEYWAQASVERLLSFDADRPFQYRVLIPILATALPLGADTARLFAIEWLFSVLSVLAFARLLGRFFDDALLCAVLSLLLLPTMLFNFVLPRVSNLWFPWDVPSVFFFALGILLLHERRWFWFYPLFAIATLNRETSCFLTILYFFANSDEWRSRRFWEHLAAQVALWLAIKLGLHFHFQDQGGQIIYQYVGRNLAQLRTPQIWPHLLSSLGFTWIIAAFGFPWIRDDFVRRGLLCLVPFGIGMFVVGRIVEIRIYGELAPLTLLATILIGARLAGGEAGRENGP
jgi:hypothetical protein